VLFPGVRVIVHVPDEGSPFKTTLLLEIVPITGAFGNKGWLITAFADAETHPSALVTVNL